MERDFVCADVKEEVIFSMYETHDRRVFFSAKNSLMVWLVWLHWLLFCRV